MAERKHITRGLRFTLTAVYTFVFTLLLVGMGLTQLSLTPHNIPEIKTIIRSVTLAEATRVADEVMRLEAARDVTNYLRDQTRRLLPDVVD